MPLFSGNIIRDKQMNIKLCEQCPHYKTWGLKTQRENLEKECTIIEEEPDMSEMDTDALQDYYLFYESTVPYNCPYKLEHLMYEAK